MKNTSFLLVLASLAVLLAACEKEADNGGPEDKWAGWNAAGYLTSFAMQTEEAQTKAAIDFSSGAISWNNGDQVLVYVPATGTSARYIYNGTYFEPQSSPLEIGSNEAYAYYPADSYSIADGKVSLTMPASVTADPGNKLPMGGIIPAGGIPSGKERREGTFKSLGSIIWVKLTAAAGKEETLSSVVMENTSLTLTGKAQVSWSGNTPSLAALDGGKTIEVACTKTLSTSTAAEFFLFAPAGSMENLSLTVNFQEEAAHFKPFTKITRNSALNLERNKVLPIAWAVNGYNTGISAKGEPIAAEGGKVLFFVDIPAEGSAIRNALGYTGDSFSGYSVYVNGTKYDILTNKGGENYIEVAENPGGTYEAYLVTDESLGLYGATPDKDVVMPFSQFYAATKADFENYPRYASYSVETGNVLSFKDAIALVNLNLSGSVKLASVKVRSLGGETLSGRADYSYSTGAFIPKESLPEAVVNCTNNGNFVQLGAGTIPVFIAPGSFSSGLEITAVTDNHLVMHKTLTPGEITAGSVYAADVVWKADENVLFFEGFDNFVWGGNIMGGSSSFGYAPDASAMGITGGRDRDGYARAYTKVAYNVAGTGYMQSDTWNDVKDATVSTSHVLTDSYFTSRNLNDWIILYRGQEYQGVLSLGTAETKRGVMKTPLFRNVQGTCDVKLSFDVCLQTGNTKGIQFQIHNGGHFDSCTIDGAATATKTYQYKNTYAEAVFNGNLMTPAGSAEAAKTWHRVEVTILGATDATTVDFRSVTASGATVGMWVDNITVAKVPGTEKKGSLRILYWNIQNGMWWDQGNNYDNFVAFVNKYNPDICVWCEAESIYKTGTDTYESASNRYLFYTNSNWGTLASRYGHNYVYRSGRTDDYPQEVTSKYPITRVQALTTNLTHGAGHFQITVGGNKLNIVTTHPYPHKSSVGNHTTDEQIEADNKRLAEMTYLLEQTVNKSTYASEDNWVLIGDFNSNSPQDCWFTGADPSNIAFAPQQYILDHTDLQDAVYEFWNAGGNDTFCCTTANAKDRKDHIYVSPGLMSQIRRAIIVNDSWTYKIEVIPLSEQSFKSPSDHRPILVDIDL